MSATTRVDTRNLEWKNNNVGSKLLSAMGWKDGMKVGKKRSRVSISSITDDEVNNNDESVEVTQNNEQNQRQDEVLLSTEGLRIMKRQDGLGIGATSFALGEASSRHNHVGDFSDVLVSLQQQHSSFITDDSKKKKKKDKKDKKKDKNKNKNKKLITEEEKQQKQRSKSTAPAALAVSSPALVTFSTSRITNSKVRNAKFALKSQYDMKCIFGDVSLSMDQSQQQQQQLTTISTLASTSIASTTTTTTIKEKEIEQKQVKVKKSESDTTTTKTTTTSTKKKRKHNIDKKNKCIA